MDLPIKATVEYTLDMVANNGDDQRGRVIVTTGTGKIQATWSSTGGMGDGCRLVENTTKEFTDLEAESLLDASGLCQGIGTYDADIVEDQYGWLDLDNVQWHTED